MTVENVAAAKKPAQPRRLLLIGAAVLVIAAVALILWVALKPGKSAVAEAIPAPLLAAGTPVPSTLAPISPANAAQLAHLAPLGYGAVHEISYATDNRWLAAATSAGVLIFEVDGSTGELWFNRFIPSAEDVKQAVVAAGNSFVAAIVGDSGQLVIWNRDGSLIRVANTAGLTHVVFAPYANLVAAGGPGGVGLWQYDGTPLKTPLVGSDTLLGTLRQLQFIANETVLLARGDPDNLYLWHIPEGKMIARHDAAAFDLSLDGKLLAAVDDREISLWDPQSAERATPLQSFDPDLGAAAPNAVAISPDRTMLALSALVYQDNAPSRLVIQLWSLTDNRRIASIDAPLMANQTRVAQLAFSPDGSRLYGSDEAGALQAWSVPDGAAIVLDDNATHSKPHPVLRRATFSGNGTTLAAFDEATASQLQIWDLASGQRKQSADLAGGSIGGVEFTADGKSLQAYTLGATTSTWDTTTLAQTGVRRPLTGGSGNDSFSYQGAFLGIDQQTGKTYIWRLTNATPAALPPGKISWIYGALSPDGTLLAARNSSQRGVNIWRVSDGTLLRVLYGSAGADGYVTDMEFAPDGQTFASASVDGAVRIWQVGDGTLLREWSTVASPLHLAFAPDGKTLAVGINPGGLELRNVADGTLLKSITAQERDMSDLAYSPDGQLIATAAADEKSVKLWSAADLTLLHTLEAPDQTPLALSFSPDSTRLAVGSNDWAVRVWGVDGVQQHLLGKMSSAVWYVAFADDSTVVGVARDGAARYWSLPNPVETANFASPWAWDASSVSPDGELRVSGLVSSHLLVWRTEDSSLLSQLVSGSATVRDFAFGPGGTLATAGSDGTVRLWLLSTGAEQATWTAAPTALDFVRSSPDGALLATGPVDGAIALWRVSSKQSAGQLTIRNGIFPRDTASVSAATFSPDGATLAATFGDGTAALWNVADGKVLKEWHAHNGYAATVAFSPDGRLLASGGFNDSVVRLWGVPGE